MIVLPIVERELRVAARRRGTYWMRVAAALMAVLVFGWMTLTMLRDNVPSAAHGRYLFRTLFSLSFVYCLCIGARVTADCLSEEKREGTLGLLFLTDLKGYDVVLGKLVATSLNAVYGLLAIIPVLALTIQLGGVTGGELWRSALVLLNTLLFSLSAGIFVSALSRHERKAMFAAAFVMLLATFGPPLATFVLATTFGGVFSDEDTVWPFLILSPGYAFGQVMFWSMPFSPFPKSSFWWSLLLVQLASWCLLRWASRILPRIWQTRTENSTINRQRERIEQWTYGAGDERRTHRSRLLDLNPFLWLAGRERWKPAYVWLYVGAVAATWLWGWYRYESVMFDQKTLIPTVLLFQAFLKVWVISEACNRLAEDQRSGALELLLSTPLTTGDILRGQWLALRRQFAWPLLVIVLLEYLVLRKEFSAALILGNLTMLLADVVTVGWVGMWLGLTARNASRAILGTMGRVLILPWGIYYAGSLTLDLLSRVLGFGPFNPAPEAEVYGWLCIGLMVNFIFGYCWARRNLLREFRTVATQRYQPAGTRWFRRLAGRGESGPVLPNAVAKGSA